MTSFFATCGRKLSKNISKEIENVCFSAEGKGRLEIAGHKYVFDFESELEEENKKWLIALEFPLYGQEIIEIDWSNPKKAKLLGDLENKLLREKNGIDPKQLNRFMSHWAMFIHEVVLMKKNSKLINDAKYAWSIDSDKLVAKWSKNTKINDEQKFTGSFFNPKNEFFSRMTILLESKSTQQNNFKLEMFVRNCFEKTEINP